MSSALLLKAIRPPCRRLAVRRRLVKISTDLEQVADLATNLGDYTLDAERDLYPDVDI
jgi:hypothetical protein